MRKKPVSFDATLFGKRVRAVRNERNLTREQLAEMCEISPVHLRNIESGNALPSMPIFMALSNVLKVSPNYLTQDFATCVSDNEHDRITQRILKATPKQAAIIDAMLAAALEQLSDAE